MATREAERRQAEERVHVALSRLVPFASLERTILLDLARQVRDLRFAEGEHLYVESDDAEGVWLIQEGIVKLVRLSRCGREHPIDLVSDGSLINEEAVFDGCRNLLTAVAVTAVRVWLLPRRALHLLFAEHPAFAFAVCRHLGHKQHTLIRYIRDLTLRSVRERVARYLLAPNSCVHAPQTLVAAHLNMRPETLSRTLRNLADEGLICKQGEIVLLDRRRLGELAGRSPGDPLPDLI